MVTYNYFWDDLRAVLHRSTNVRSASQECQCAQCFTGVPMCAVFHRSANVRSASHVGVPMCAVLWECAQCAQCFKNVHNVRTRINCALHALNLLTYFVQVSWIRHRDLHVLTVGAFSFTSDARFSAHRDTVSKDWVLILQHANTADTGRYQCSIPTKPVTAHTVMLTVLGEWQHCCWQCYVNASTAADSAVWVPARVLTVLREW